MIFDAILSRRLNAEDTFFAASDLPSSSSCAYALIRSLSVLWYLRRNSWIALTFFGVKECILPVPGPCRRALIAESSRSSSAFMRFKRGLDAGISASRSSITCFIVVRPLRIRAKILSKNCRVFTTSASSVGSCQKKLENLAPLSSSHDFIRSTLDSN